MVDSSIKLPAPWASPLWHGDATKLQGQIARQHQTGKEGRSPGYMPVLRVPACLPVLWVAAAGMETSRRQCGHLHFCQASLIWGGEGGSADDDGVGWSYPQH